MDSITVIKGSNRYLLARTHVTGTHKNGSKAVRYTNEIYRYRALLNPLKQYCTFVGIALFEATAKVTTRLKWVKNGENEITTYIVHFTLTKIRYLPSVKCVQIKRMAWRLERRPV